MSVTPYPDPRYPELRCEDPTALGCATPDDRIRWFGNDVADWFASTYGEYAGLIATACLAIVIVLAIATTIEIVATVRHNRRPFTEDDIIGDAPLDQHFPYLRRQDDE